MEASSAAGIGGIGTTIGINLAQDEIQTIAVPKSGYSCIEAFPATGNKGPEVLVFPKTEQESTTLVFLDNNPVKPQVETFPAETPKELGDNILWANRLSDLNTIPKSIRNNMKRLNLGGAPQE